MGRALKGIGGNIGKVSDNLAYMNTYRSPNIGNVQYGMLKKDKLRDKPLTAPKIEKLPKIKVKLPKFIAFK